MDSRRAKRKRPDTSPVKPPERTIKDGELELLRALEEDILKEEARSNDKVMPPDEDEDYDDD